MASRDFLPAYLKTRNKGGLESKIADAWDRLKSCSLCPRECAVNRLENQKGFCRSGLHPIISSYSPHFGEERPLVGRHGSGTIFFTHCNLGCSFCQNYDISHGGLGREISCQRLAQIMLELQRLGCHNINFVSPTHFVPQILRALHFAIAMGLSIPLVYNTGGYDSLDTLKLLDGVFDIYMPDLKFMDSSIAHSLTQAADYPEMAKKALKEMFRQVGDLNLDEQGIAFRGLLIRHLVLPENMAGTEEAMRFVAENISPQAYVNIMDQYYPCGDIPSGSPLQRRITKQEFDAAVRSALAAGLSRLDKREKTHLIWW
jgi:putative pyruvate formate lyase activating enzyme